MGVFACIASILLLYAGVELSLHSGTSSEGPEASGLAIMLGLGYGVILSSVEAPFIFAIVYLIAAVGLFHARRWGWGLSIMISVVSISLNLGQEIVLYPVGLSGWVALLIAIVILFYLTRPKVRRFFGALGEVSKSHTG